MVGEVILDWTFSMQAYAFVVPFIRANAFRQVIRDCYFSYNILICNLVTLEGFFLLLFFSLFKFVSTVQLTL